MQFAGALQVISKDTAVIRRGLHIYTAGVALQEFFILCFVALCIVFLRRINKESRIEDIVGAKKLTYFLLVALGLISVSFPTLSHHERYMQERVSNRTAFWHEAPRRGQLLRRCGLSTISIRPVAHCNK